MFAWTQVLKHFFFKIKKISEVKRCNDNMIKGFDVRVRDRTI